MPAGMLGRMAELPTDPLARFLDIYAALNADRRWSEDASALRFAAMTTLAVPGDAEDLARQIRELAEAIKRESGVFGNLSNGLRFVVAAILLVQGDTPRDLLNEVKRVRDEFRRRDMRRGGTYETMAILAMRCLGGLEPIKDATITRFRALYEEMKRHHWWLTGPDDFPACAILTAQAGEPSAIGAGIEQIYQALRAAGFKSGDPLQTAANILYLKDLPPQTLATRYRDLATEFEHAGISMWQSDYDELAILAFLDHAPRRIVDRVVELRREMERLRPDPGRLMTFNLAASIGFVELVQLDAQLRQITDAKALLDMQAIIAAQQAAVIAAVTSAGVAASVAASN